MTNKLPLPATATIITLNESAHIANCIQALKPLFAEVLVLDSLSTDDTRAIAQSLGARVVEQGYLGDGPQKACAASHAQYDWIMSIDADERPDDDFVDFCKEVDLSKPEVAHAVRRKNFVGTRQIRASGFYPDYVIRLYNRTKSGYELDTTHAKVCAHRITKTNSHLLHYTYTDYKNWFERMLYWAEHGAHSLHKKGKRASRIAPITHATFAFIKKYLLKGGILQGLDGFTVAITTAFASFAKYAMLLDMQNKETSE